MERIIEKMRYNRRWLLVPICFGLIVLMLKAVIERYLLIHHVGDGK